MYISENFLKVKENIEKAKLKSVNPAREVSLVVVSKNRGEKEIIEVIKQNHYLFGENRVQELREKYDLLSKDIEWHMIGHLQTNKVKYIVDKVSLIHSLDSFRLAKEINKRMENLNRKMDCLVQVNMAEEDSKFGLNVKETIPFIKEVANLPWISIKGLMTIAPAVDNPEEVRPIFKKMYNLFLKIKEKSIPNVYMENLSMGMTNDYKVAIEEGANIVRVGSGIFGPRIYK